MMNKRYWERKDKGSASYGSSRGDWRHRSSAPGPRRPPQARQNSVPSWEKKFCESICLAPWRKIMENKRFIYLYDDVLNWNDSGAEEAFKNAKSRFWAEMNGLPCDLPLPDPDTYIDNVDWNAIVDPELLLDLERGPDVDSKTSEAESVTVDNEEPLLLNSGAVLCNQGWGSLDDEPVPENKSDNWEKWMAYQAGENTDGSKGWNNWDDYEGWNNWDDYDDYDDGNKINKYSSNWNLEGTGYKNVWNEDGYGNRNMARGTYGGQGGEWKNNGWGRNNHGRSKDSDGYWKNRGFKNSRGSRRQEQRPHWVARNSCHERW